MTTDEIRAIVEQYTNDCAQRERAWYAAIDLINTLLEFCVDRGLKNTPPEVDQALAAYGTACVEAGFLPLAAWAGLMDVLEAKR